MAISLTKPGIGSTGWGGDVNNNFSIIEDGFNGDTPIGPLKVSERLHVDGVLVVKDGIAAPAPLAGKAIIYVDAADGDLKIKFSDGTVKTIVTDT